MTESQILRKLDKLHTTISLRLAIQVVEQFNFTKEVLDEEGHPYIEDELLQECVDYVINEL